MTLRFAANLSILWTDRPFAERFERAAAAGFDTVELWWPGLEAAEELPELTARNRLGLALLNFDGGDMAAGERGLANDPERHEQLRANIPAALRIAEACGCTRLNLLVGQHGDDHVGPLADVLDGDDPGRALRDQRLLRLLAAVPDDEVDPGAEEVLRHRAAHDAEADEADGPAAVAAHVLLPRGRPSVSSQPKESSAFPVEGRYSSPTKPS